MKKDMKKNEIVAYELLVAGLKQLVHSFGHCKIGEKESENSLCWDLKIPGDNDFGLEGKICSYMI